MQLLSDFDFDPLCNATLYVANQHGVQNPDGLSCTPCMTPVAAIPVTYGRAANAGQTGNFSTFTIGFSGGAAAAGVWVVFSGASNTGTLSISGGTNAWIPLGPLTFGSRAWGHLATTGEPSTYTVTYSGAASKDGAGGCLLEVLNAGSSNPDSSASATSTATCPSATASLSSLEMAVITFGANATGLPTAPSGYTIRASNTGSGSPVDYSAIATKEALPSGTVTPGSWSLSGNLVTTSVWKP